MKIRPADEMREMTMPSTDLVFLAAIVAAFVLFGVTLGYVSWWSEHKRH
jgi:hypothetical protein